MGERISATATVQLDDDQVRVTEWRFAPGAETGWHRHAMDYVVVPLTAGELLLETDQGERRAQLLAGQSYSRLLGTEHNVVNAGTEEVVFIEIELKRNADRPGPT
ncbi:MAG: cupin domain-containing protein [Pseudomonas oryzihabitans]